MVQRECGALHRHPPAVHRHGERGVDEQGHGRAGARLGLGHLDVTDLDAQAVARVLPLTHRPGHRVRHGAGDVPGLAVAELPLPRRPAPLPGGPGEASVALAGRSESRVVASLSSSLPSSPHRLGGEPERAVRVAPEVPALPERLLELGEGARLDRGVLAELTGERVEVEVGQLGPRIRLGQLLGELVELGHVLQDPGAVPEPEPLPVAELLGPVPVLARAAERAGRSPAGRGTARAGEPNAWAESDMSSSTLLLGHRGEHPLCGRRPLREGVEELVDRLRVLREVVCRAWP
jgi:hypothetical protein